MDDSQAANPGLPDAVRSALLRTLKAQFRIRYDGDHGARHWGRVRENGLRLAQLTGARILVLELFALLHDSQRHNEYTDPQHGPRAARYAAALAGQGFDISKPELDLLVEACQFHTGGMNPSNITVATCWDADRLDLGRVGIYPDPKKLCTDAGRDPAMIT